MKLEEIFDGDFVYDPVKVNQFLIIIKTSKKDLQKQKRYSTQLFQMMKEIVNKNINNFISLLTNSGLFKREDINRGDLISDCYCIFDKCLSNYKISVKNNFYFYFNKSMSRSFFREYRKAIKKKTIEAGNYIVTSESFSIEDNHDMMQFLLDNMKFSDIQKEIIKSKIIGQRLEDFFILNPTISSVVYYENLKKIKRIIEKNDHEIGSAKIKAGQFYYSHKSRRTYEIIELKVTGAISMRDADNGMIANHTKKEFMNKIDRGIFELLN